VNAPLQAGVGSRGDSRVVRRACLQPAQADDVPALRFALEDALRTAEFNDCGRLVVVRRLRLAGLPPRAGPALMARALEDAWRAALRQAVPAAHAQAPRASAVYFGSRAEARLGWLAQVAQAAAPPVAWYWHAALPELTAVATAGVAIQLQQVVERQLADDPGALLQALGAWRDAPLRVLAALMNEATGERLLDAATASAAVAAPRGAARLASAQAARGAPPLEAAQPLPRAVLQSFASKQPPPAWVLALRAAAEPGHVNVTREQAREWARWLSSPATRMPLRAAPANEPEPELRARGAATVLAPAAARAPRAALPGTVGRTAATVGNDPGTPAAAAWRVEAGLPPTPREPARHRHRSTAQRPMLPWLADAAFTRHGGLLLLLNLLHALRFGRVEHPPPGLVDALLLRALDLTGAPLTDAQRAWFDGDAAAAVESRAARQWLARVRRSLRRRLRLGIAELVRRPAWVSATRTHIDVVFALDQVDLRLRRAALDGDPGWLPWFGRIVAFHFVARECLPEADDG
jgi:hypothetical protein